MYDLIIEPKVENQFFFHPRFQSLIPAIDQALTARQINGQFCVLSSGTTSSTPKGYALPFDSLMNSAKAVNQRLNLTPRDRWGLTLPPYHIGGLSIYVRSLLTGQRPAILHPWEPVTLVSKIAQENVTVISLVPTQVYDLVAQKISAPHNLKAALIGGDFLGTELESRAISLGWPLIRTFGMTEVASGLAIGGDMIQGLNLLPHHEIKTDQAQRLWVKSQSLFTCEFKLEHQWQIKMAKDSLDAQGFYPLPDRAELKTEGMIPLGRDDGSFKSSGHLISMPELQNKLDRFMLEHGCWGKMDLLLTSDDRKGKTLTLVFEESLTPETILAFEKLLIPIRIELKQKVELINKTELGKTKY